MSVFMQGLKLRAGIVGIERGIEKKQRDTDKQVNQVCKHEGYSTKGFIVLLSLFFILFQRHLRTWMLSLTRYYSAVYTVSIIAILVKAKDMVGLVNKFAAKMEDKKGSVSEDEVSLCAAIASLIVTAWFQTVQFKSYLLSVGISNPVTRYIPIPLHMYCMNLVFFPERLMALDLLITKSLLSRLPLSSLNHYKLEAIVLDFI